MGWSIKSKDIVTTLTRGPIVLARQTHVRELTDSHLTGAKSLLSHPQLGYGLCRIKMGVKQMMGSVILVKAFVWVLPWSETAVALSTCVRLLPRETRLFIKLNRRSFGPSLAPLQKPVRYLHLCAYSLLIYVQGLGMSTSQIFGIWVHPQWTGFIQRNHSLGS